MGTRDSYGVGSVSYTHLDVYKRQVYARFLIRLLCGKRFTPLTRADEFGLNSEGTLCNHLLQEFGCQSIAHVGFDRQLVDGYAKRTTSKMSAKQINQLTWILLLQDVPVRALVCPVSYTHLLRKRTRVRIKPLTEKKASSGTSPRASTRAQKAP